MNVFKSSQCGVRQMRILLSITTILAAGLATAAQADSRYRNLDANGVDLVSGGFLVNFPEGSIGSAMPSYPWSTSSTADL